MTVFDKGLDNFKEMPTAFTLRQHMGNGREKVLFRGKTQVPAFVLSRVPILINGHLRLPEGNGFVLLLHNRLRVRVPATTEDLYLTEEFLNRIIPHVNLV